ncbi:MULTISPECIES: T9SS type A sorting domain-containing protein [unclassified Flavobacterium]|uniref:T9SS type A sorting domain-containing protein n=1 Tax=unclassified Flavobacterium TaxID=196869 RepID=UPI0025C53615|nr:MULTISPECIES: T9SS type A sorting domain-containing protein [unclassified Flavobacterium]
MKKIYLLLLLAFSTVSFGQLLNDNLNYSDNALLSDNGWTAHSGAGTNPIAVGAANGLSYAGYTGLTGITASAEGNAAVISANGEDVNKSFGTVNSGTIYYSFLVNVSNASAGYFTHLGDGTGSNFAARVFVQPSANAGKINFGISNSSTATYGATDFDLNTTYLLIVKYEVAVAGTVSLWVETSGVPADEASAGAPEASASGGGQAAVGNVHLRQYSNPPTLTIDGIYVDSGWFGNTPPPVCPLSLSTPTKVCDAVTAGTDTYTVTIPFAGGGTQSYTLNADSGTISGANPSVDASGDIIISGITEGTALAFTAVGGDCNLTLNVTSPVCTPAAAGVALPYTDQFNYTVGESLNAQSPWSLIATGTTDEILVSAGNLDYTGLLSTGNSISFSEGGLDTAVNFATPVTTGTIYYSFLVNVASLPAGTALPEFDPNGGYFAGVGNGTNFGATLWTKKVDGTEDTYNFGLEVRTATGTNTTWTTQAFNIGETNFVVVGYMFGDSATASDDMASLWINPVVGDSQNVADLTDTHTGADLASINRFFLRQDSTAETGAYQIDALRVGQNWEEVTGSNLSTKDNQIAGLKVYPNPVTNGTLFINTAANGEKAVTVYDVLGKQVLNTKTSTNAVNVSNLKGGVYIVKITEGGNTATRKMVIK